MRVAPYFNNFIVHFLTLIFARQTGKNAWVYMKKSRWTQFLTCYEII